MTVVPLAEKAGVPKLKRQKHPHADPFHQIFTLFSPTSTCV